MNTRLGRWALALGAAAAMSTALMVPVASSASAATTQSSQAVTQTCGIPVVFGLHGMNEGPSPSISAVSPELQSFDTDLNALGGGVGFDPVPYPTVYPNAWSVITSLYSALNNGENALQAAIMSYSQGCSASQDKIALVGYSMGAWVINKWIEDYPQEWNLVRAVVLYGDPCYVFMGDEGLVRELSASYGCMPASFYPYPAYTLSGAVPFGAESYSDWLDPVTGFGWGAGPLSAQVNAAIHCNNPATCSHLDYTGSDYIRAGAELVIYKLVG